MKRIPSTMVSDEAKTVLVDWKNAQGFSTLDEALQDLLLEFKEQRKEEEMAMSSLHAAV